MTSYTKNLSEGNLLKILLQFAFPYIVANFLQALYGATDLLIIGHFCNENAVSAVALGSYIMQTITILAAGFTVSATILVGNCFGSKKYDEIQKIINTALFIFTLFSLIMTILLLFFSDEVLKILNAPKASFQEAKNYLTCCAFGIIFIIYFNIISSFLRGVGNSFAPMIFIGICSVINFVLNLLFIGCFHLGPVGAAISTVISQAVSVILSIIYIKKGKFIFSIKFRKIKYYKDIAVKIFKLGIPLALQDTIMPISFLVLYTMANTMGVFESAAYGTVTRLNAFLMLPAGSFAMALTVITAQNVGAQKHDRAFKALGYSIAFSLSFGIIFFLWQQIIPSSAMSLFTNNQNIINAGSDYLATFSYDYLLVPLIFCLHGFLNGLERTTFTALNNTLGAFFIRIPCGFIMGSLTGATLFHIGIAAPMTSIFTTIVATIYILKLKKNNKLLLTKP